MNAKEKLMSLLYLYTIPIIVCIMVALTKDLQINGEEASTLCRVLIGFLMGMAFEGFLIVFGFTIAILMGKK